MAIEGCPAFDEDAAYRAMDFLGTALPEIAEAVFARTASLLNLGPIPVGIQHEPANLLSERVE